MIGSLTEEVRDLGIQWRRKETVQSSNSEIPFSSSIWLIKSQLKSVKQIKYIKQ